MDLMEVIPAHKDEQPVIGVERREPKHAKPSGVQVRLPRDTDWVDIRRLVRKHHEATVFSDLPFSEKKFNTLQKEARKPAAHQCLIVAEARGQIVGLAWFSAGEYVLSEQGLMTTTHLLAVDTTRCGGFLSAKVFLRLVRAIVIWSESRNSRQVLVHVTTGNAIRATDKLLRASGGICLGGGYSIPVPLHARNGE